MRKILLIATLTVFGATPAAAQLGFGAHAGISLPTGDYGDEAELGFLGGLDLVYPLLDRVDWYSSADAISHGVDGVDNGVLYVPVMTGIRAIMPVGPVRAFVGGQLGAIFTRGPSDDDSLDPKFGTEFGFNLGGGVHVTENVYAGIRYWPLGDTEFEYDGTDSTLTAPDVSFFDVYVGFGVF
ncbi:MAG: outer membrane beta-barrel protein [Gemmatimonadota bacterium]